MRVEDKTRRRVGTVEVFQTRRSRLLDIVLAVRIPNYMHEVVSNYNMYNIPGFLDGVCEELPRV